MKPRLFDPNVETIHEIFAWERNGPSHNQFVFFVFCSGFYGRASKSKCDLICDLNRTVTLK